MVAASVRFRNGVTIPALGQGSVSLASGRHSAATAEEALRQGISLGMTVIDTSEGYNDGRTEELIGRAISGVRDKVFLISKVDSTEVERACQASLNRLRTDYLDLYLLHWPTGEKPLAPVVASFKNLCAAGKIRSWGVSNFRVQNMKELFSVPDGDSCATNQVRYSLNRRSIEIDLLPWCELHGLPVMAYSPLGSGDSRLMHNPALARIAAIHNCSTAAIMLAWVMRSGNVIAICASVSHVEENSKALSLTLTSEDIRILNSAFPMRMKDKLRVLVDRTGLRPFVDPLIHRLRHRRSLP